MDLILKILLILLHIKWEKVIAAVAQCWMQRTNLPEHWTTGLSRDKPNYIDPKNPWTNKPE